MTTRISRCGPLIVAFALLGGCLSPTPWWAKEMKAWEGASADELEAAWGEPRRTIPGKNGSVVYVYESHTTIDRRQDVLGDPGRVISDDPPQRAERFQEFDCLMYFEIDDGTVVDTSYDGAGCEVVSRDPRHRG
jgi:hypothetical protein